MPKTIRNIYDDAVSFDKLLKAHKKARRGKREKREIIVFELNLENELLRIEKELEKGIYKHGKYKEFKIENFIKPYFVPQFITTSYAGIENRGMHKASKDVQKAMKTAKNKCKNYYIIKMDITKYFQNIDLCILNFLLITFCSLSFIKL